MQLYEDSRINNEIRNTYEYPTIKNLLISSYKVDTKNASNKAQSITNQLLNDKDYQTLKAKKQTNSRDVSSDNYLKKFVSKVMANYKGKQQAHPATQPTENQAQAKTAQQPQDNQNAGNANTNNENVELLNILNNQTQTYNQVLRSPNEIQYLSLDDSGNPSYDKSNFDKEVASISSKNQTAPEQPAQKTPTTQDPQNLEKKDESLDILTSLGITLPKFLSRYLEANNKNDAFYSILNPEVSSKLKAQNIHVIGIYKDPKTKKWIAIDSSGTKRDVSQLKGENLNNEENLMDVKLEDSDINAIEKTILPIISNKEAIEEIKAAVTDINNTETPYNLELQLGKPLNESIIQKFRYRLNEKEMLVGGPKQFYVLFKMTLLQSEDNDKENEKGEENSNEKKDTSLNFSKINEEQLVEIVKGVRSGLLMVLEDKLKKPLEFKLTKTINRDATSNKENADNSNEVKISVIVSEGDDSYINASKTDDIISGKFTLKASINNSNQNSTILNKIGNALEQAAQYSGGGNSDNSGTHL